MVGGAKLRLEPDPVPGEAERQHAQGDAAERSRLPARGAQPPGAAPGGAALQLR